MEKEIKITFTGDAFLGNNIVNKFLSNNYSFDLAYRSIKNIFNESDYVVCNLETPLSIDNNDYDKGKYVFCSPLDFAKSLKNAGVDCFTLANNHCLDNGTLGIKKTIECLKEIKADYTGLQLDENDKYLIKEIDGLKIGIYSCTYGTNAFNNGIYLSDKEKNMVNLLQEQELNNKALRYIYKSNFIVFKAIRKIFKKLKMFQFNREVYDRFESNSKIIKRVKQDIDFLNNNCDFVFVCMHDGSQNNIIPSKRFIKNASMFSSLKVNAIIGNHEHVIQKIDKINKTTTAYCLGNFTSPQGVTEEPFDKKCEYSILFNIYIDVETKTISKYSFNILKQTLKKNDKMEYIDVDLLYNIYNEEVSEKVKNEILNVNKYFVKIITGKNIKEIKAEYYL